MPILTLCHFTYERSNSATFYWPTQTIHRQRSKCPSCQAYMDGILLHTHTSRSRMARCTASLNGGSDGGSIRTESTNNKNKYWLIIMWFLRSKSSRTKHQRNTTQMAMTQIVEHNPQCVRGCCCCCRRYCHMNEWIYHIHNDLAQTQIFVQ